MRLRLEGREPGAHRVGIDPERQRRRRRGRGIGREPRSVGVDRAHRALGSDDPGDDDTVDDADLSLVRIPGCVVHTTGHGAADEIAAARGSSREPTWTSSAPWFA